MVAGYHTAKKSCCSNFSPCHLIHIIVRTFYYCLLHSVYYNLFYGKWLRQQRISAVTTLTQISRDMIAPVLFSPFCITTCYMVDGYHTAKKLVIRIALSPGSWVYRSYNNKPQPVKTRVSYTVWDGLDPDRNLKKKLVPKFKEIGSG